MMSSDVKMSSSCWWESRDGQDQFEWLAENIGEMDQRVKQLLKMIEADEDFQANKLEEYSEKKPELIAHFEEFCRKYHSLAKNYVHLAGDLQRSLLSDTKTKNLGMSGCVSEKGSPLFTPYQTPCQKMDLWTPYRTPYLTPCEKLDYQKSGQQAVDSDLSLSSGCGSSDVSIKEGPEYSTSSDSESESLNSSVGTNETISDKKIVEAGLQFPYGEEKLQVHADEEDTANLLKARKNVSYEQLLERLSEYKKELRVSSLKLELSEREVTRLRTELKDKEVLVSDLQSHHEQAQREIKKTYLDLEIEKIHMVEIQEHVSELESEISESEKKIEKLTEELEITGERLKVLDQENAIMKKGLMDEIARATQELQCQIDSTQKDKATLESELDKERRQVLELHERIVNYKDNISDREHEVRELKAALADAYEKFSLEKTQLESDICGLSGKNILLSTSLEESELRAKSLEDKFAQVEAEKLEVKRLFGVKELEMQSEINKLEADLYEMGVNVIQCKSLQDKITNLEAEKSEIKHFHEVKELEMKGEINKLKADIAARDANVKALNEAFDRLKLRHDMLEKEVNKERMLIANIAEEKREAIRQLCFSMEYYRSKYQDLHQAFSLKKHQRAVAL